MYLYVRIPTGTIGNSLANYVSLAPYPSSGVDVVRVEYTTAVAPTLTDKDTYQSFNPGYYNNEYDAVGKVAPGGWSTVGSDTIVNSGPLQFVTADKNITAVRILLRQRNYIKENNAYIYTYGLSDIDIRYEKYLPTGKTFIRFDAPTGNTIKDILNVSPKIYNVSPSMLSSTFGYRVFYPVISGSQATYGLVNPQTSDHVYVEVTLNMLDDMIAPVLSDLIIEADYNL